MEHVLPTTLELVRLLREFGAEISGLIAKPYSIDPASLEAMRLVGVEPIVRPDYAAIESEKLPLQLLRKACAESKTDGRTIVIIDVGGYFAEPLTDFDDPLIAGAVEDTTFGHNRYKPLIERIKVPVVSVARSELKEIEARFVGKDAIVAMDLILRNSGILISGRQALVIGYGMIGKNVARTLRRYDLKVAVYDLKDTLNLKAHADGFSVYKKNELLKNANIIFSATGTESIPGNPTSAVSYDEMLEHCRSGVVLASVGSRASEFDVVGLRERAARQDQLGPRLVKYTLSNDKDIVLASEGTAVNFSLPSIPTEVLDLVFAEIVNSCLWLLKDSPARQLINESPGEHLDRIAKEWLRMANPM